MKTVITFVTAFFLINFALYSQTNKFQLGIDGGPNLSSLRGFEKIIEVKPLLAFSVGISAQYNFSNKLSVVSGLGFERKGNETKDNIQLTDENGNKIVKYPLQARYDYLNVPLLLRFTLGENKFKFFVNAGGYVGFLVKANYVIKGYDNPTFNNGDFSDDVKGIDFGISGGLGIAYQISDRLGLTFEVRDNLGLLNITTQQLLNDGTNKLNSTNFLLGINFGFGGS